MIGSCTGLLGRQCRRGRPRRPSRPDRPFPSNRQLTPEHPGLPPRPRAADTSTEALLAALPRACSCPEQFPTPLQAHARDTQALRHPPPPRRRSTCNPAAAERQQRRAAPAAAAAAAHAATTSAVARSSKPQQNASRAAAQAGRPARRSHAGCAAAAAGGAGAMPLPAGLCSPLSSGPAGMHAHFFVLSAPLPFANMRCSGRRISTPPELPWGCSTGMRRRLPHPVPGLQRALLAL